MMGLSDGPKSFRIGLAVLIQYRSVTDTHPASHPARHFAVAITLDAKASSLKTGDDYSTQPNEQPTKVSGLQGEKSWKLIIRIPILEKTVTVKFSFEIFDIVAT